MSSSQLQQLKDDIFLDKGKVEAFDFKASDFKFSELDAEFSSLYQLFISNKAYWENNRDNYVISYLAVLCDLMIGYYQGNKEKLAGLEKIKLEIDDFKNKVQPSKVESQETGPVPLSSFLWEEIKDTTANYASSFTNSTALYTNISALNANRIYWIYCKGLVTQAIAYLQNSNFSNYIKGLNTDEYLNMLDKPREVLYVLSVGIYALRFMLNLIAVTKSIMQAESKGLSTEKVFQDELEERGFTMVNDGVWGTVNLLTNYNKYFNISADAATNATVVFLAFDVGLLMTQWWFEATKYSNRVQELKDKLQTVKHPDEKEVINRQLDMEADKWEAQCAFYAISIAAAGCVFAGFGATLVVSAGLSLAVLSMLGTALYATADEYKKYMESRIAIKRELANDEMPNNNWAHHQQLLTKLTAESNEAYANFCKSLIYNGIGAAFIITAGAISFPAALSVTAVYMAYRINNSYKKEIAGPKQPDTTGIYRLFGPVPTVKKDEQKNLFNEIGEKTQAMSVG